MVRSGQAKERPYVTPRIHACVFDPKLGTLERLEVSTSELFMKSGQDETAYHNSSNFFRVG